MYLAYILALVSIVSANIYYDFSNDDYNEVKNSRNFTGKVVLVTGSSAGIGEGIVKLFSILGAQVVVTGRNETEVKIVSKEVQELSPYKLKPLEVLADLTKSDDLNRLLSETIKTFGKLDVLVNNAGIYPSSQITDKDIMKEFDLVFNIDLRSYVELIHISVPYLEETNGTIISISSIAGIHPMSRQINYSTAKAALVMAHKVLALELGPKIRVNIISPGAIQTARAEIDINGIYVDATPLKRIGEPLDIAKGVAFLASTDAEFITGAELVIDGGLVYNWPNF